MEIAMVNRYFKKCTQKVYVDSYTKIESFEEYLSHRYQDCCYYYSFYALMGLNADDYLVRGFIDLDDQKDYHHGWVEFEYEGELFVFDSHYKTVIPKDDWYKEKKPKITYKKTQKEILDEFLNEKCAMELKEGFWQFKYIVTNTVEKIPYDQAVKFDRENGYVPFALTLARLTEWNFQIKSFIAYTEPSG